ncbi:MAG TPA: peptidylprolyl isomerase [Candidatus Dormibacteraeota bacterium]|nr:peptidylprolyl isomerase [Candidatus Dormibacteraeota bacterium]
MARRERTTGLPRPRPRTHRTGGRRFMGITWTQKHARIGILAGISALLLVVVGLLGYHIYDNVIGTPNKVVLSVGDENFTLRYYSSRLVQFFQANGQSGSSQPILEQQLLTQIQTEALTNLVAKDEGISLDDNAITQEIATELGVSVGGQGSPFDTLYRQKLKTTSMSDSNYRKLAEANLANAKLVDKYKSELGATADQVTLRIVVRASQADAQSDLAQIKSGTDMGLVAQKDSTDVTSRQNDGLMTASPPSLLAPAVQAAIKDKKPGLDLYGPVQVGTDWWVIRFEKDDPAATLSDSQKTALAQAKLTAALAAKRASTKITTNLTGSDVTWAVAHAG